MPELPEVETLRRALAPLLEGRRLERVEIADPRLSAPLPPRALARALTGERVERVGRRGKYLLLELESGATLAIHLRMSGSLRHGAGRLGPDPYRRARVRLDDGTTLAYRDVRRFGTWRLLAPGEREPFLAARLGPEPLERRFRPAELGERLRGRRAPLKAAILDQRVLAGVGNIYADEALWYARLHPLRPAGSLDSDELRALHGGIRTALRRGLARQGSTLRDYALLDGRPGGMQREFKVYGRVGEPCERCGTPIDRIRTGGRGTSYCPACQRLEGEATAAAGRARPDT